MIKSDTQVFTTEGFKSAGNIKAGDFLYSWDGKPVEVVSTTFSHQPTYTTTFSDKTTLFLGEGCEIRTFTIRDRKQYNRQDSSQPVPFAWPSWSMPHRVKNQPEFSASKKTVKEVAATVKVGSRGDTNHSIPTCQPLQGPSESFLEDPYYVGYWLGDGYSSSLHTLAVGGEDVEYVLGVWPQMELKKNGSVRGVPQDFHWMQDYNLRHNKHVPSQFYLLPEEDRLSMLQGMMDSDGYAGSSSPHVEFCTIKQHLAEAAVILARSLGEKPVMSVGKATLDGRYICDKYRVTWRPARNSPFKMPRKRDFITFGGSQESRNFHRMIKGCFMAEVSECVSIGVKEDDGMFLAGEGFIPVCANTD